MKARLVPVYFESGRDDEFDEQLKRLGSLFAAEAKILEPVALGSPLPEADAVVFPQLLGDAYSQIEALKEIDLPLLIITSEFGTVSMWDWEIDTFLKSEGLKTFAPHNLEMARKICRCLGLKRELKTTTFLVFQDNPGEEGFQADIFKRFYWWEDRCTQAMKEKFGVTIAKKSFKRLGEEAKRIPDPEVEVVKRDWNLQTEGVSQGALNSALRMYIALKREIEQDENVRGVGINCLNESHFSDTTPCLAWNMLFQELGIIWGCEGDTMSLLTKYVLQKSLDAHIMLSNLYPFLMGMAALKHERIEAFPEVEDPQDHILVAHCGYLGVLPQPFAAEWTLRPKVLAIVDENATAIDARLPTGDITLAKLHPTLDRIMTVKGSLEGYAQYPGSDCRNGAIVRVTDGYKLVNSLYSHHYCILMGRNSVEIEMLAKVFDLEVEEI